MGVGNDGNLHFILTDEGAPMSGLRLDKGEDKELSSDLVLIDKSGRAGVVGSNGGGSDPHLRPVDGRQKLRLFLGLRVGGEPRLYVADEEGSP